MLYLTNETGKLKLFKWPSYQSLNTIFSSFSLPPPKFGTGNGNEAGGFFLSGLVFLITGWMEHIIMHPSRIYSVQNSGRDSFTLHTDTRTHIHTHRDDRSNTQIHS
jgi:hypothetical protein